jgi:hypothetical protein
MSGRINDVNEWEKTKMIDWIVSAHVEQHRETHSNYKKTVNTSQTVSKSQTARILDAHYD